MVASGACAIAADRETRMKPKARACCTACLAKFTEVRQCSGKIELRCGKISVGLDGPSQPCDRFGIRAVPQLGHAGKHHPDVGGDIARREAEGVLDMSFRGQADGSVGGRQISVQCQSALALSDALSNSVCLDLNDAQGAISLGMVRRHNVLHEA